MFDEAKDADGVVQSVDPSVFSSAAHVSEDPSLVISPAHPYVVGVTNLLMHNSEGLGDAAWHQPAEHLRTRDTMEQCISHLIYQRHLNPTQAWVDKLPDVSKRIERHLYCQSRSIDE
ncbi:hypothetical protein B484DRAFT_410188 [Ochromonadaceae sp. CCMP2298]|nr:hypothetical protein B484DRAFT_410188 [Ochromonadaceae sp. CCMP2298]